MDCVSAELKVDAQGCNWHRQRNSQRAGICICNCNQDITVSIC